MPCLLHCQWQVHRESVTKPPQTRHDEVGFSGSGSPLPLVGVGVGAVRAYQGGDVLLDRVPPDGHAQPCREQAAGGRQVRARDLHAAHPVRVLSAVALLPLLRLRTDVQSRHRPAAEGHRALQVSSILI